MKAKFSLYAKHIVLCLAFYFAVCVYVNKYRFSLPHLYTNAHDRIYLFIYCTLLGFFYFNYYYLIPKLYFSDKKFLYYLIIIVFLLFFLWISTVLDHPSRNFLDFEYHSGKFPVHPKPFDPRFPPPPHGSNPMSFEFNGGPPTQYGHTTLVYLIGVVSSLLLPLPEGFKV